MYNYTKRIIDIFLSILVIVILMPLMLMIMVLLLLVDEHKIFYIQKRIGYKNRIFKIYKFATMKKNSPFIASGIITLPNDKRVFKFGSFLRKYKLNELPQIFNVLIGNMSFVGPRPLVSEAFNQYDNSLKKHIYDSKPGITGIGSIVFRNEENLFEDTKGNSPIVFYREFILPYKGRLELWYNDNKSLKVDFLILILTVWVIVFPKSSAYRKLLKGLPIEKIKYLNII